jgi:hypothetical protein
VDILVLLSPRQRGGNTEPNLAHAILTQLILRRNMSIPVSREPDSGDGTD